jgi:hypothetical protein
VGLEERRGPMGLQMREDREKEGAGEGKKSRREIDSQPPPPTVLFATSLRQILLPILYNYHNLTAPALMIPLILLFIPPNT